MKEDIKKAESTLEGIELTDDELEGVTGGAVQLYDSIRGNSIDSCSQATRKNVIIPIIL